ncbi:MAG: nuclear transport factor 2 family protein [Chitinophagaceae bacterium]|nr:nuclear transport factor 2 family protein [Chitinophagaceae bacterium]
MKITKQLKAEILDVYEAFWGSLLHADIQLYAAVLDADYRLIGTTEKEIFFNKQEAVHFLKSTADQMAGSLERRKSKYKIELIDGFVLITEQFDAYVLIENDWTFYGKTRVSTWMHKKTQGWKIIQQHFSFPDAKTEEGQTIGLEKISKENLELREAIKRRTIELESKNQELEIESSLERVRTVAMAMQRPDDMLDMCQVIAKELENLSVAHIRNIQTAIINVNKEAYLNYEYFRLQKKKIVTAVEYKKHKDIHAFVKRMLKDPEGFFSTQFKGASLKQWIQYQVKTGQFVDPVTKKAASLHYYFYSIGPGALGISTYAPLTKEAIALFKRFRNVFQLAYRRFMDIEKAMEQAKEAQVEASLEKVRAQALGMRKPEDLPDVCEVLFKELQSLGFSELRNAMVNIHNDEKRTFVNYDYSDEIGKTFTPLFYDIHPVIKKQISQIRKADDAFSETVFKGKDLESWKVFRKSRGEQEDKRIKNSTALYYYFYSIGTGSIGISAFHAIGEEKLELLKRFRNVFAFAYRRYMDVAQAEAQAREAQIETALEKVRSSSLAMQTSAELGKVVTVLLKNLHDLGFVAEKGAAAHLIIFTSGTKDFVQWSADPFLDIPVRSRIPFTETPVLSEFFEAKEKGLNFFTKVYSHSIKNEFFTYAFKNSDLKYLPAELKQLILGSETYTHWMAMEENSAISVNSLTANQLSENQTLILKRFAIVFEQAYTRFLDLQKAEAQAREAQIELALERVRARTMAMQHSEELSEAVAVMFEQFKALGEEPERMAIEIVNEKEHVFEIWATQHGGAQLNTLARISLDEPHVMQKMYRAWKSKTKSITIDLQGKELEDYFNFLKKAGLPVKRKIFGKRRVQNVATFSKGILTIITPEPRPQETINLLERFATVFDGTYTRFLDLQKAEAQAREAQIELGLERVRARAMAMQHSDELSDLVDTVFKELTKLDFAINMCIINIIDESTLSNMVWGANPDTGKPPASYYMKFEDYPFHHAMMKGYQERASKFIYVIEGEEKKIYDEYLFTETEFSKMPLEAQAASKALKKYVASFTFSNFGGLQTVAEEDMSDEKLDILARFGKVFDLTYTRFNDLQKAEAQAREAKIEAALERTRTQSMIMQHSKELDDTLKVFHEQVLLLGIPSAFSFLWLPDEKNDRHIFWAAWKENDTASFKSKAINYPLDRNEPATAQCLIDWKSNEPVYSYHVPPAAVENYFAVWQELIDGVEHLKPEYFSSGLHYVEAFMKYGCFGVMVETDLTVDEKKILSRFAIEFERTYTRFLDLQRAEAQAREAQIEAALERVRSRSMAMHTSEELKEVIKVVYQQLTQLNINIDHAGFVVDYTPGGDWHFWIADEQDIPSKISHPYFESVWATQFNETKAKGADFFATQLNFEEKNKFYKELLSYVPDLPDASKDFYLSCPGLAASTVLLENVGLYIENFSGIPYTEEENTTLMRFGKVFQQTYTRFLDLQKAEAQAREAQIEAALERVRARAMAMHTSQELQEVSMELRQQMGLLGQKYLEVCAIHLYEEEEDFFESWGAMRPPGSEDKIFQGTARFPKSGSKIIDEMMQLYASGQGNYVLVNEKEKAVEWFGVLKQYAPQAYAALIHSLHGVPIEELIAYWSLSDFSGGSLLMVTHTYPDESSRNLLRRAANVFDLAYRRFRDLKKAEAQAREAQIEAALERVRSRSMAMHKSNELLEAGEILFLEMQKLGIESLTAGYVLIDKEEKNGLNYTPHPGTKKIMPVPVIIPHNETSHMQQVVENWKKGNPFFIIEMDEEETIQHQTFIAERSTNFPLTAAELIAISPARLFLHNFYFKEGYILIVGGIKLLAEQTEIMLRFAKVFQQTYTRFLDLQKAEAQAREAKIEAALEKVRSRSLAMHKADELGEVITVVVEKLKELEFSVGDGVALITYTEGSKDLDEWMANPGFPSAIKFHLPYFEHPVLTNLWTAKDKGLEFLAERYTAEENKTFLDHIFEHSDFKHTPQQVKDYCLAAKTYATSIAFQRNTSIFINDYSGKSLSQQEIDILKRFSKVFEQAYIRFLDLQRAEAQAREAQIEAALERVRSRSLAMHKSEELSELVAVLYEKMNDLGIVSDGININVIKEGTKDFESWLAAPGQSYAVCFQVPYFKHPVTDEIFDAIASKKELLTKVYSYEEKTSFFTYLYTHTNFKNLPEKRKRLVLDSKNWEVSIAFAKNTALSLHSYSGKIFSDSENDILKRFAKVFEQSYTRFLDLQKAEAQAREAQIEASLERVRSKTMAMHNSQDVGATVVSMFDELVKLGIDKSIRCGIGILDEIKQMEVWVASTNKKGETSLDIGLLDMTTHPLLISVKEAWKNKKAGFTYELAGEDLKNYFKAINDAPDYPVQVDIEALPDTIMHTDFFFTEGVLFAFSPTSIPEESAQVLKRFAGVFGQTYRRYLDLQKAEAQAIEAQIEAALERVRSRTLAMQKSDELAETAAVLFQQLIALGIHPNRLYIAIIMNETGDAEFWLTDEDGSKVSTAFAGNMNDNESLLQMFSGWKAQQKSLVIDMHGEELQNYFKHLGSLGVPFKGGLSQQRRVQYIAYFSKGFIGMASPDEQPAETLQLLERFAAVFNLTFTRFNDLKIAEAHAEQAELDLIAIKEAKQKAEEALTELQSTQKQLIQSEKMASLGELTAGIAHEIQNPLNFVNNFSEVSKELLDEMKEAIEKGDTEEAKEIMNDVIQNLEKINHHGKRADGIVKGMLQHSRSSSNQKEATNINALADEYLRLAYHGLRAKDKSFNATMKTEYDETIGNVNIIPQDIGRVILNLINNAFYAVSAKASASADGKYEPTVSVTTKKVADKIIISVNDNGNGIPQKILNKIFQPFFTTKPTGQGTGLGLSLSYDIVKAHGGELKVETKEGEGSTFIIVLPCN